MAWTNAGSEVAGINERGFEIAVGERRVPGVYWSPATGEPEALVLLGHGGTAHKKIAYIEQMAGRLVQRGCAAMAIDGPGHGDRTLVGASGEALPFEDRWHGGGGTEAIVADWRGALDFIEQERGARPAAWWGLSMGTMMGLPVVASEPRIQVALLGLMGTWGPNGEDLRRLAPSVACPLRFLLQWDDEIVPRAACLELFDLLGSAKKSLHANPGEHAAVPLFEFDASADYLVGALSPRVRMR